MKLNFPVIFHRNKKSIGTATAASMGFYALRGCPAGMWSCGLSSLRRLFACKFLEQNFKWMLKIKGKLILKFEVA